MKSHSASAGELLQSCGELVQRLQPECDWVEFFAADRTLAWSSGQDHLEASSSLVNRVCDKDRPTAAGRKVGDRFICAFTLYDDARLVGALCLGTGHQAAQDDNATLLALQRTLRPVLELATQRRQIYLGRHITRQIGAMLDSQYDLATGLLNRTAAGPRR